MTDAANASGPAAEIPDRAGRVLVFGASGYVGRHLTPRLLAGGHRVRAAARRLRALEAEGWDRAELVAADALRPETLAAALEGVDVAYYLVHSMGAGADFPALDREAARNFAEAAAACGVKRILYLGGLSPPDADSAHLVSRRETGEILRAGAVPVTELRAGIIVGPGSAAFEVMRDLVAHLPIMVSPRWIRSKSPPIALEDLLGYMLALPWIADAAGEVLEAAGPETLSYDDMMRRLARMLGKPERIIIPVPVLTPRMSAYWMELVTSVPANVGRALIMGLKHDFSADDRRLRELAPRPLMSFEQAVAQVFEDERNITVSDRWREGAFELRGGRHDVSFYGVALTRTAQAKAPSTAMWAALEGFGSQQLGYYHMNWVWRLRAWIDRRFGGRTAPLRAADAPLSVGQRFDFWRVLAVEPMRRLTLYSLLKAPGAGGFELEIEDDANGSCLVATIHWHPEAFKGLLYWFLLWPPHALVLSGMTRALTRRAERIARESAEGATRAAPVEVQSASASSEAASP